MSYEGSVQKLCKNGHLWETDCRDDNDACYDCKAEVVWANDVDDTNCESWGSIDMSSFLIAPDKTEECPTCHHVKVVEERRYRIPTPKETRAARRWIRTWTDDKPVWEACHAS